MRALLFSGAGNACNVSLPGVLLRRIVAISCGSAFTASPGGMRKERAGGRGAEPRERIPQRLAVRHGHHHHHHLARVAENDLATIAGVLGALRSVRIHPPRRMGVDLFDSSRWELLCNAG